MLSRRGFIVCASSVVVLPADWASDADRRCGPSSVIAIAHEDPDCRHFPDPFAPGERRVHIDDGAYLQNVSAMLDEGTSHAIVGLTRDSEFVILQHLAAERGFRRTYLGRHHYQEDGLHHTLSAEGSIPNRLAAMLSANPGEWGRALGANISLIVSSRDEGNTRAVSTQRPRPVGSAGYLVSWAFRKED